MWKSVIGATSALVIAGSSLVYAQQRFGGPGGPGFERGGRMSPDDMAAMADARIAALKAGLRLTPEQDRNWAPFDQALRDLAKLRAERMAAFRQERQQREERDGRDDDRRANPFERLQRRADTMTRFSAALKRMADTGAPLYQSLDDNQKHRFMMLARVLRQRPMMSGGMRGEGGGGFHRHGDGEDRSSERGRDDRGREDWRRDRDGGRRGMDRGPHEL
jgi:zinc resistance-associated protein